MAKKNKAQKYKEEASKSNNARENEKEEFKSEGQGIPGRETL